MVDNIEQISRTILDYLRGNPDAEDTLEGITDWWMKIQKIESSAREVAEALDGLVRRGLIDADCREGGKTLYRIRRES